MTPSFELLIEKFLQDDLTPAELNLFLHLVKDPANQQMLRATVAEKLQRSTYTGLPDDSNIDLMFSQMLARAKEEEAIRNVPTPPPRRKELFPMRVIQRTTAAVLILLAGSFFFWINRSNSHRIARQAPPPGLKSDVAPGGDKAMLTLSDGSTISLDNANKGTLAQQGNARVVKLASGALAYIANGKAKNEEETTKTPMYNTVTTPRGGQYSVTLPDGTQVWLNASSSITYPTAFTGDDRKVAMKGEAYFEVVHRPNQPFTIQVKGMEVHEIGTHFDINAYEDEAEAKTTLLEGAVKIIKGFSSVSLRPGEQAVTGTGDGIRLVRDVDVEASIAWKEGLFSFDGADLPAVMRQLARWYDLDVHYEGTVAQRHFTGKVFRHLPLSETLKILELSHVHFRIEGNRLTVMP